jgi:hypothetical protein
MVNDFEKAVSVKGDDAYDEAVERYEVPTTDVITTSSLSHHTERTSLATIASLYPNVNIIEDIPELDIDELFPKTRYEERECDTDVLSSSSSSLRKSSQLSSRPSAFQTNPPIQSFRRAPQPYQRFEQWESQQHAGLPLDQQQQEQQQQQQEQQQQQQQQQQQLLNRSQRSSPRRSGLLVQLQQDSYRRNAMHSSSLGCSLSSFYDTPSVDDMGSLNSMGVDHSEELTTNPTVTSYVAANGATTMQHHLAMTRQQSMMAIQRAISVRNRDGGFMTHVDEDGNGVYLSMQGQRPNDEQQPYPDDRLTHHNLSFHDEVQQSPPIATPPLPAMQQQHQRPQLRSQESFISHTLSYHSHDADSHHRSKISAGSVSPISNAGTYMDQYIGYNHADRIVPRVTNQRMDTNNSILNHHRSFNRNHTNDDLRYHNSRAARFDDNGEQYDDFSDDTNRRNFQTSYQGQVTRPPQFQHRDQFNFNENFQMQRGRYNQSERLLRGDPHMVNTNRYEDTNRNIGSSNNRFMLHQPQQSLSYRHVPTYAPAQPVQYQQPPMQQQQQRSYERSQSYYMPNQRDTYQSIHQNTSTQIPPSSHSRNGMEPLKLEISPGVFATVRGADETERAVASNHLIHLQCMACTVNISCIADAQYVLCPVCKVVGLTNTTIRNGIGGVGLGFCTDE